jgi:hypothetical protein
MTRPLFEIAKEIALDWKVPTPQAKAYLKGLYYLVGMDDRVADLDAMTTVRMLLLYSKDWRGDTADRVKAELQAMRSAKAPINADLLQLPHLQAVSCSITHCELCDASLGSPAKFVEAYTHWKQRARMCMHCSYFLSPGIDLGDGALYIQLANGNWCCLHGMPTLLVAEPVSVGDAALAPTEVTKPKLRHQLKFLGRRIVRKCASVVRNLIRRPA